MKSFFLVLGVFFYFSLLVAQTGSYNPNTGDTEFDTFLMELNSGAQDNQTEFKTELSVEFEVPTTSIDTLFRIESIQPADVFLILTLAKEQNKPIETIIPIYKKYKAKGWGLVLKELKADTKARRELIKKRIIKKNEMIKAKRKMIHDKKGPKDKRK